MKPQWKAYYKRGICNQMVVEGIDEDEAVRAAFAEYRRHAGLMDNLTADIVVEKVVPIECLRLKKQVSKPKRI